MNRQLEKAWAEIVSAFAVEFANDAGVMFAHGQTGDIAKGRFMLAAELGAERLNITLDEFVAVPRFARDAPIFGRFVLLDEARVFVEGLHNAAHSTSATRFHF